MIDWQYVLHIVTAMITGGIAGMFMAFVVNRERKFEKPPSPISDDDPGKYITRIQNQMMAQPDPETNPTIPCDPATPGKCPNCGNHRGNLVWNYTDSVRYCMICNCVVERNDW